MRVVILFALYTITTVVCEVQLKSGLNEEIQVSEDNTRYSIIVSLQRSEDIPSGDRCTSDSQCEDHKACWRGNCMDPCARESVCSVNAICKARNHLATCECKSGASGDAYVRCVPNTSNTTYQCDTHDNCPSNQACVAHVCTDPCIGRCRNNTHCDVSDHIPACVCKEGYSGNPLQGCTLQVCSGQWPPKNAGEKKFSVLKKHKINWFQASDDCFSKGMRLASIENEQQQIACNELLEGQENGHWWIGGSDLAEEGKFTWIGRGLVSFTNYSSGQPDNANNNENCLELVREMDYFYWNDFPCRKSAEEMRGYICEYY